MSGQRARLSGKHFLDVPGDDEFMAALPYTDGTSKRVSDVEMGRNERSRSMMSIPSFEMQDDYLPPMDEVC